MFQVTNAKDMHRVLRFAFNRFSECGELRCVGTHTEDLIGPVVVTGIDVSLAGVCSAQRTK